MMASVNIDDEERTVVIHRAYLALHVADEAARRSGDDRRELAEDAQRLARGVTWSLGVVAGAGVP